MTDNVTAIYHRERAKQADGSRFLDRARLLVETLFENIALDLPMALHPGGDVWVYSDGRFVHDRNALGWAVASRLGDHFKPDHRRNVTDYAQARLANDGHVLTDCPTTHLLNVRNGMLDPFTEELHAHGPQYLSTTQLPVEWDPTAAAPVFDGWLRRVVPNPELAQVLLEDVAKVFDIRPRGQRRAVFIHGPTRSGKSTFVRLLEAIVGADNRASEELIDLAKNQFRGANLFGKMLNVASDIRTGQVIDVGLFKKLTGEDTITAERKREHPFSFRWYGLMVFTMNKVPTTLDMSRAFFARIRPYRFPITFVGHEDPQIEQQMMRELPGVFVRLVRALQVLEDRGAYYVSDATKAELEYFMRQSDQVALFLYEATTPGGWTKRGDVHKAYATWASDRRRGVLSRHHLYEAVEASGIPNLTRRGFDGYPLTLITDYDHDDDHAPDSADDAPAAAPEELQLDLQGAKGDVSGDLRVRARSAATSDEDAPL